MALDDEEGKLLVAKADEEGKLLVEVMTPEVERGDDKSDEGRLLCTEGNSGVVERVKLVEGALEVEVAELFKELVIPREIDRLVMSGRAELEVVFGGRVELEWLPMSVDETLLLPSKLVRVWIIPPSDEDGGLVIVEGGPEVEPEKTIVLSVGVVTETPEELEPRTALVTPPIKLVMGLRISPLLELGDTDEDMGERVIDPSKEVVLPPKDGGETIVGNE